MIQVAFEPALDPFHAAFRMLRQLTFRIERQTPIPRLRILDVFLAEPGRCLDIRLSGPLKRSARIAATYQPPTYGSRPSAQALFSRMGPMQDAALQTLVMHGFLGAEAFGEGVAALTDRILPDGLSRRIEVANASQQKLLEFLFVQLDEIPFGGPGGLKDRTHLGEFRYDIT